MQDQERLPSCFRLYSTRLCQHETRHHRHPTSRTLCNADYEKSNGLSLAQDLRFQTSDESHRTPPIEDYKRSQINEERKEHSKGTSSSNSSHPRLPHTPPVPNGPHRPPARGYGHTANTSVVSLGERLLEKLHWRERIRHYTWTFFTMTMATGGIANVLYEGTKTTEPHN